MVKAYPALPGTIVLTTELNSFSKQRAALTRDFASAKWARRESHFAQLKHEFPFTEYLAFETEAAMKRSSRLWEFVKRGKFIWESIAPYQM
jgi:hypothetical protein